MKLDNFLNHNYFFFYMKDNLSGDISPTQFLTYFRDNKNYIYYMVGSRNPPNEVRAALVYIPVSKEDKVCPNYES